MSKTLVSNARSPMVIFPYYFLIQRRQLGTDMTPGFLNDNMHMYHVL